MLGSKEIKEPSGGREQCDGASKVRQWRIMHVPPTHHGEPQACKVQARVPGEEIVAG
jgi:hypothetical protein